MSSTSFGFELDGIAHLLKDKLLSVPVFQRSYSWTDEHVTDFWNDLEKAFTGKASQYFLGSVVLMRPSKSGGRFVIVDGQQRLATTAVFLACVRDVLADRQDPKRAGILEREFLLSEDFASGESEAKLYLNADDNDFYRKSIVDRTNAPTTKPSHALLQRARSILSEKLAAAATAAGQGWVQLLKQWTDFLSDAVKIIVISVDSDADAYVIYETLNDRGADLTIADLLKNYLFGRSGPGLEAVRNAWVSTISALDLSNETAEYTTFLRHHWSSENGATRERDLFRAITERVATAQNVLDFAMRLQVSASSVAALQNPEHDRWKALGTAARAYLETLHRLDLEQNRPLLLAAMQHFEDAELKRLLRALVSWSVRGLVVGGIGGGVAERVFCQAAVAIRAGTVKTTADVLKLIDAIVPKDQVFEDAFAVARVPKARLARYYLRALDKHALGQQEPELVPNADEDEVNLEHVLPKSAAPADWGAFTDDERKDLLWRLGNLALLAKGPNGKIGSKPFAAKKPILSASKLPSAQRAANAADWNPAAIQAAQVEMAKLAVKVWPR